MTTTWTATTPDGNATRSRTSHHDYSHALAVRFNDSEFNGPSWNNGTDLRGTWGIVSFHRSVTAASKAVNKWNRVMSDWRIVATRAAQ